MKPSSPPVTWDEKHIKALLRLHLYPARIIKVDPWHTWIEQRGGLNRVFDRLRNSALSPSQEQLLKLILMNPDTSSQFYYTSLHISSSTYFIRLSDLIQTLLLELNAWKLEPEAVAEAEKPVTPTNLPSALTSLIGADETVAAVVAMLRRPGVRLLTLMGPGGVGKTRLAMAAGARLLEDFQDGVFFVALETIYDFTLLPTQIARLLNVETAGTQSLFDALKTHLRERRILLVLDNFEQLVGGGPFVTSLLQGAEKLKVLVTSREALNVYGENRFTVPELPHPQAKNLPPIAQLNHWPAVALFVQRVQARHPAFKLTESNKDAVVAICNQLDGLPLAIELAAAQIKFLSADQALPQLEYRLKSLKDYSNDRPLRQKTLWDAIDWSYQLLSDAEKALFRRLSVFGREWSLEAASAVCQVADTADNLHGLADKSLLRYVGQTEKGGLRFQMVQAVREYALEQLATSGETRQIQRQHASYYLAMAQQAEPFIATPEQLLWVKRIEKELENFQIALQWMLEAEETAMAFDFLGAAWRYYQMLNIWSETRLWSERALKQGAHLKSVGRVKTLWGAGLLATAQGDHAKAMALAEVGVNLAREIGDQRLVGLLLQTLADGINQRGDYQGALRVLEESLQIFRELHDQEETAWVLGHIAGLFAERGEAQKSREMLEEGLGIFRTIGHRWAIAHISRNLSRRLLELSDLDQAKIRLEESLTISQQFGDWMGVGWTRNLQGQLAMQQGDLISARHLFEEAAVIFQEFGSEESLTYNRACLEKLALIKK